MNGILVIDKPLGPTSHDMVDAVRRLLKIKKVGHTGTLDPMATGVLPLVLGSCTRLARYLSGTDKTYRATLHLGISTRTLDAEGEVTDTQPVTVTLPELETALLAFRGSIQQIPPMFSAKKIAGTKLYKLARQGVEVPREAKTVMIHRLELISYEAPFVVLDVTCSAGTYVRVLAHDIGQKLACGAHLSALRRTSAGPFALPEAVALATLQESPQTAANYLLPATRALSMLPSLVVSPELVRQLVRGKSLTVNDVLHRLDAPTFVRDTALAVSNEQGDMVAVVRAQISHDQLTQMRRESPALLLEQLLLPRSSGHGGFDKAYKPRTEPQGKSNKAPANRPSADTR